MSKVYKVRLRQAEDGRELAFQALYKREIQVDASTAVLNDFIMNAALDAREIKQATYYFYGVLTHQFSLDELFRGITSKPLTDLDPLLRISLRLASFQLYFSDSIPDHAAVNSACTLLRKYGHEGMLRYANANLRELLRRKPALAEDGAAAYSVNPELFAAISQWLSAPRLLSAAYQVNDFWNFMYEEADLVIRCNELRASPKQLLDSLINEGASAEPLPWPEGAFRLCLANQSLTGLRAFKEGYFYVQGQAAQLPSLLPRLKQGDRALDLCAAPGGKSFALAARADAPREILATDLRAARCEKMKLNADRLGIEKISVQLRDATQAWQGREAASFDLVLADVPCSSLGLIRQRPDLRFHTLAQLPVLVDTQAAILRAAATAVRPGGQLLYSTCTINPAENEGQIKAFLLDHADFALEEDLLWPEALLADPYTKKELARTPSCLQLYPHVHGCEGFFIACLRRKK